MTIGHDRRRQARKDLPKNASQRRDRNRKKRGIIDTNLGKTLVAKKGGFIKRLLGKA